MTSAGSPSDRNPAVVHRKWTGTGFASSAVLMNDRPAYPKPPVVAAGSCTASWAIGRDHVVAPIGRRSCVMVRLVLRQAECGRSTGTGAPGGSRMRETDVKSITKKAVALAAVATVLPGTATG